MTESYDTILRSLLDENRALRERLIELRVGLSEFVGYHQVDGAVPVEKIRALLRSDDARE